MTHTRWRTPLRFTIALHKLLFSCRVNQINSLIWLRINLTEELNGANSTLVIELNFLYRRKQAQSHQQKSQALTTSSRHCPLSTMQEALLDMTVLLHILCADSWHCCRVCAGCCLMPLCRALLQTSNCTAGICLAETPQNKFVADVRLEVLFKQFSCSFQQEGIWDYLSLTRDEAGSDSSVAQQLRNEDGWGAGLCNEAGCDASDS